MNISDKLKLRRKELGLTQKQAAELVGTYQQRYQHWESGHTRPDPEELKKLADGFGVSTDWLLGSSKSVPRISEFEKEMLLLREEAKPYGAEAVQKLREILPVIYKQKKKREERHE